MNFKGIKPYANIKGVLFPTVTFELSAEFPVSHPFVSCSVFPQPLAALLGRPEFLEGCPISPCSNFLLGPFSFLG